MLFLYWAFLNYIIGIMSRKSPIFELIYDFSEFELDLLQ